MLITDGTRVKHKITGDTGKVVKVINQDMVAVLTDDGQMEIPMYLDDLEKVDSTSTVKGKLVKGKPKTDYLEWKRDYWMDLIQKTGLTIEDGEQILDAGCGPAGIFMALPNAKVDAVDPLLNNYEDKLDHFDKSMYPAVRFFNASLETYDSAYQYDKIFCLNAINHVADLKLSIDKLVRMLKPNGHLIMSIDAHNYTFFKKIFSWLPGDILHPHQYNLEEYEAMVTERNLKLLDSVLMKEEFFFNYFMLIAKREL